MPDIWDSIKETGKSLGGAAAAPFGAVYDLATMGFDDKDDDFGTMLAALSKRGGDILDPMLNPESLTGAAFTGTMDAMNAALREGVSEPISTAFTMASHADAAGWGTFLSGEDWAKAYEIAQNQNAGQAFTHALLHGSDVDPFDYKDPYEEKTFPEYGKTASTISWGANILGSWYLDPFVLAGKGAAVAKARLYHGELAPAERADLYKLLAAEGEAPGAPGRIDRWLDWTEGKNALGRQLEAPEILHGTIELKKYAAEPHVVAGLLADANKINDPILRRDAKRRILAVAAGDTSQIRRLEDQVAESATTADVLRNMLKKGSLDLKLLAANPKLKHNPVFISHLERQLDNINNAPDSALAIDKFMDGYNARLGQLLDTQGNMPRLPGLHAQGKRAIKRQNEVGLNRDIVRAHEQIESRALNYLSGAPSTSSVFQKGLHTVPLVVVKTAGLPASVWTKFPTKASDALRQTHFTGVANLHDWGGATTQLDSMMRLSGVAHGDRLKALSEAFIAKSEPEKQVAINRIEDLSMKSMARTYSEKYGTDIDQGFIEELMRRHANSRGERLSQMRGRAYAATEQPPEMAFRMNSAQNAENAVRKAESTGFNANAGGKWRVDQISDDGTPLSLPLLETQLANSVPLMDMGIAKTLLDREFSHVSRLSKAWAEESKELTRLAELKGKGAHGLDKAIAARRAAADWAIDAAQQTMRVWKFGVLFRLGYPIRVIMDDHWRIWTQINAATFYANNGKEFLANWRYNHSPLLGGKGARQAEAREKLHNLKVRRHEILDELDDDLMVNHGARQADLARMKRSAATTKGQITRLQQRIAAAEPGTDVSALRARLAEHEASLPEKQGAVNRLFEELGDYGPDDLKKELGLIEEQLAGGLKSLLPDKKMLGQADVFLPDGLRAPGAFAGPYGHASLEATKSHATFDTQLRGVEDRMYQTGMKGSHRTIQPDEPGHIDAWADVLNYQFRQSPVAMFFVKGGTVDDFAKWVKQPEQAQLRQRLAHYAHDPEDWGHRVNALVHDYIPTDEIAEAVATGRVSTKLLQKQSYRPAVHGRVVADNLGTSGRALGINKAMNRAYQWIGEMPTDRLSRHPFFSSMYRQHLKEQYEVRKLGYANEGRKFTQDDVDDLAKVARRLALHDLKRTLFDISAHSHAAHVMRFLSPFFAAHQEVLSRWWRIVGDSPHVVRRFTQAFDAPRHLELVIDEEGNLVKPGDPVSRDHRLLLQLPRAFGGANTDISKGDVSFSKWSVSENSFNLILQGGLANPGAGPLVTLPVEYLTRKYANEPEIARVARIFNPFPPTSPVDTVLPATLKRLSAYSYSKGGPGFGVGQREYNSTYSQNIQDLTTDFILAHGREPNQAETDELMLRAGRETNTDMVLRVMWNSLSPAPASPRSKYSAVQHGWRQISDAARQKFPGDSRAGYEWAYAQFKEKWGEAYMPLIYSSSNNPAHLSPTTEAITGIKRYRGVLDRVDPALSRVVLGAYGEEGEFSPEAANFLKSARMRPGSGDTYFSNDEPRAAMEEQMARRGWQKYGELTGALTAQAQAMGLNSYLESKQLADVKRAGVARIRQENWAFDRDYGSFDSTQFDRYISDLKTIVKSPALAGDTEREDIRVLGQYLLLRDFILQVLQARKEQGLGGVDAQANAPVRKIFTAAVGRLVESNTHFESYVFNGTLERDPLLVGE